jgi:hypothetical protein
MSKLYRTVPYRTVRVLDKPGLMGTWMDEVRLQASRFASACIMLLCHILTDTSRSLYIVFMWIFFASHMLARQIEGIRTRLFSNHF